jgi:hypothetical protein
MVSISHELPVEAEARLRSVLRATDLQHLPGVWSFKRVSNPNPGDALALVKDVEGWCALRPASGDSGDETERFALTLSTFPAGVDNSGYVGWLATTIKERLGSGVFVVCGDNPGRGGIFDYLGYPVEAADAVRKLLEELRRPGTNDGTSLDLRVFEVAETSADSEISTQTRFQFRQDGDTVEAAYSGGQVVRGSLLGRRDGDRVTCAWTQVRADGGVSGGQSVLRVAVEDCGHIALTEDYTRADGPTGRNVLRSGERVHVR